MEDRRSGQRMDCSFPLDFIIENKRLSVNVVNISNSGICFFAHESIPLFRELSIQLLFDKDDTNFTPIKSTGIVVRCDKKNDTYDTALFFMDISIADQNRLTSYINTNLNKSQEAAAD